MKNVLFAQLSSYEQFSMATTGVWVQYCDADHCWLTLSQYIKTCWHWWYCRHLQCTYSTLACICPLTFLPFSHRWMVTSWSPCTRSCGGGIQMRRVTCQRLTAKGSSVPMSNEACAQASKRPVDTQHCNRQPCVEWVASSWGQVRSMAAVWKQTRSVG